MLAEFDTGGWPLTKFRFAESGLVAASAGNSVKNEFAVGKTAATLTATPTASAGIVQLPLLPRTVKVYVSFVVSGVLRGPTVSVGRVSATRHGVIDTKTG